MPHASIPDFSSLLSPQVTLRVVPRDPVLSAVEAHAEAWAMVWCAPTGRVAEIARDRLSCALEDLLATPCASGFGALILIRHLRWLITQDAISPETADLCGRMILAREADLTRFTGFDMQPEEPPAAATTGRLARAPIAATPPTITGPMTVPALHRLLNAARLTGEILTAALIIGGGVFAYGYLPTL